MEVNLMELNDMLVMSFRYAFGRRTYVVHTCADLLMKYRHMLYFGNKQLILREIKYGIAKDQAGGRTDVDVWEALANDL